MKNAWKRILGVIHCFTLIFATACGGSGKSSDVEPLQDVNVLPEDGVITKEQFKTVAGEDKEIQFTGEGEDGITYVWTFDASQIQNPTDQNLKISFTSDGLDDVKEQANNATDALKMTMEGKGVIAVPTLTVTIPKVWEANSGLLLKEQGGSLARMSDVTIETNQDAATTTLTMKVTSLDGESFVVGGVAKAQNAGADNANQNTDGKNDGEGANNNNTANTNNTSDSTNKDDDTEKSDVKTNNKAKTCTISISCATLLNKMDEIPKEKQEFVPADGLILAPSEVEFEEGESVHDVLKRVCKAAGIHMESSYTPVYDSAYVEGINQLYEFDAGEQSGWMYKVNGWFPNYGCSRYEVSDGDVIEWVYTCDLGNDVGDNSMY